MCVVIGANHVCEEYVDKASCQKARKNTLVVELDYWVEPLSKKLKKKFKSISAKNIKNYEFCSVLKSCRD